MYTQPGKVQQKLISFPYPIYSQLDRRAKKVGVSFSEYLRYMALLHLNNSPEPFEYIEQLDKETEEEIKLGINDLKTGKFTKVSGKEIDKYLESL